MWPAPGTGPFIRSISPSSQHNRCQTRPSLHHHRFLFLSFYHTTATSLSALSDRSSRRLHRPHLLRLAGTEQNRTEETAHHDCTALICAPLLPFRLYLLRPPPPAAATDTDTAAAPCACAFSASSNSISSTAASRSEPSEALKPRRQDGHLGREAEDVMVSGVPLSLFFLDTSAAQHDYSAPHSPRHARQSLAPGRAGLSGAAPRPSSSPRRSASCFFCLALPFALIVPASACMSAADGGTHRTARGRSRFGATIALPLFCFFCF